MLTLFRDVKIPPGPHPPAPSPLPLAFSDGREEGVKRGRGNEDLHSQKVSTNFEPSPIESMKIFEFLSVPAFLRSRKE
jgi:hypothetical protein